MADSSEANQLLTEIRDLLAARERHYAEYLARHSELEEKQNALAAAQMARVAESQLEIKRSRIRLFVLALIIGILLWAFLAWLIVRTS